MAWSAVPAAPATPSLPVLSVTVHRAWGQHRHLLPQRDKPMPQQHASYAQSGETTADINASAAGVLETARQYSDHIGTVYAGRHGLLGALMEGRIDTSQESTATMARLTHTPGDALDSVTIGVAPLEEVADQGKRLPRVFVSADCWHSTSPCRPYLIPLHQGEAYPSCQHGLPDHIRLTNRLGPKSCRP